MARTFSREEFYDLVWSKPMTHLAKEFSLSDVALHKVCKKHGIPNPPLGWWAKQAAGKPMKRTPLPPLDGSQAASITIASGELRSEPDLIAAARENARVLVSTIDGKSDPISNAIVAGTITKLRKAKPATRPSIVSVGGPGLIKIDVAPASADRVETILHRIAAVGGTIGIEIVRTDKAAVFKCHSEIIGFSIGETTKRQKHVQTDKERAEEAAWHKRNEKQRSNRGSWRDSDLSFSYPTFPEWDYYATGLLSFELEQIYLRGGSPRRSYRDAKVQRLENMAVDIAVGIIVLAAAIKEDRRRREEEAERRAEESRRRELILRGKHVEERRSAALKALLDEVGALDRLRRLVTALDIDQSTRKVGRVAEFLGFANKQLADRESALSADSLEQRLENEHLFGDDDDYQFRVPYDHH